MKEEKTFWFTIQVTNVPGEDIADARDAVRQALTDTLSIQDWDISIIEEGEIG
jgi:hypothetical protein